MQMKLACYSTQEKFEGFKLGKDFLYGGDFVKFTRQELERQIGKRFCQSCGELDSIRLHEEFRRDEKDPLNRFPDKEGKGRFDGRTFGAGKFVLEIDEQDKVLEWIGQHKFSPIVKRIWLADTIKPLEYGYGFIGELGNIHKNPELFEKISKL